jgi:Na+/H+ antiporter NhaD/arsenite permease-like protein
MCLFYLDPDQIDLNYESLISTIIWEILASVLALWIVIKHFRELRNSGTGSITGDCFTVLIKSHAFYFVAWVRWVGLILSSCFAEVPHVLALLLWLASTWAQCLLTSWCVNLWLCTCAYLLTSCLQYSSTVGSFVYGVVLSISQTLQMFVLGPRLILSLRGCHAKLMARSDEGTGMTSIYFQAGGDALAGEEV